MALKDLLLIGAATPLLATVGFYAALFLQRSGLVDATLLPFFAGVGIPRKNVLMATLAVQYLFVIASGFIANSVGAYGGYFNNSEPRQFRSRASGVYARLHNAHANLNEGFYISAIAIFVATFSKAPSELVLGFALIYMASRVVYYFLYVLDLDVLRSQVFFVGTGAVISIFILSIFPNGATNLADIYTPVAALLAPLGKIGL